MTKEDEPTPPMPYNCARERDGIGERDGEQLDAMSKQRQKQRTMFIQARALAAKGDTAGALALLLDALEPNDELNALDKWRMKIKQDNPKE